MNTEALRIATELCARFEGYAKRLPNGNAKPYVCPAGVLTVGYGTTGKEVEAGKEYSHEWCESRLRAHLAGAHNAALRASPDLHKQNAGRQAAIADFIYNLGATAYRGSTLRRKVNAGEWGEARRQIKRWVYGGGRKLRGLVLRREAEARLM